MVIRDIGRSFKIRRSLELQHPRRKRELTFIAAIKHDSRCAILRIHIGGGKRRNCRCGRSIFNDGVKFIDGYYGGRVRGTGASGRPGPYPFAICGAHLHLIINIGRQ